MSKSFNSC